MHRRAGILGRDKNVRLARFIRDEKTVTGLMDRQFAGDKIRFSGQDVTILADARDFAGAFELAQAPGLVPCARRSCVRAL